MTRQKSSDYGVTWWNCDYCKLFNAIMQSSSTTKTPPPCKTCNKAKLDGATPEISSETFIAGVGTSHVHSVSLLNKKESRK